MTAHIDTEGKIVNNDLKKQFMTFLQAKDDNLLMQTSGCLLTLVTQSKVSQALLFHSKMFPVGIKLKSILLQSLMDDSAPKAEPGSPSTPGTHPNKIGKNENSPGSSGSKEGRQPQ